MCHESNQSTRQSTLSLYLASWWAPSALFITLIGCWWLTPMALPAYMEWVYAALLLLGVVALLGIFVASITNFLQKRWLFRIVNLLGFLLFGYFVGLLVLWFLFIAMILGPSEDYPEKFTAPEEAEQIESQKEIIPPGGPAEGIHDGQK